MAFRILACTPFSTLIIGHCFRIEVEPRNGALYTCADRKCYQICHTFFLFFSITALTTILTSPFVFPYPILLCFFHTLFYFVFPYPILLCFSIPHSTLFFHTPFYFVFPYPILLCFSIPHSTLLFHTPFYFKNQQSKPSFLHYLLGRALEQCKVRYFQQPIFESGVGYIKFKAAQNTLILPF